MGRGGDILYAVEEVEQFEGYMDSGPAGVGTTTRPHSSDPTPTQRTQHLTTDGEAGSQVLGVKGPKIGHWWQRFSRFLVPGSLLTSSRGGEGRGHWLVVRSLFQFL